LGEKIDTPLLLTSDSLNLLPNPDLIADTSDQHSKKMKILKKSYSSQMDKHLIQLLEGISLARGARIHTLYGEAFNIDKLFSRSSLNKNTLSALQDLI
jgi:hypothetical protein